MAGLNAIYLFAFFLYGLPKSMHNGVLFIIGGKMLTMAVIITSATKTTAIYIKYELSGIFLIKCIRKVKTVGWNP